MRPNLFHSEKMTASLRYSFMLFKYFFKFLLLFYSLVLSLAGFGQISLTFLSGFLNSDHFTFQRHYYFGLFGIQFKCIRFLELFTAILGWRIRILEVEANRFLHGVILEGWALSRWRQFVFRGKSDLPNFIEVLIDHFKRINFIFFRIRRVWLFLLALFKITPPFDAIQQSNKEMGRWLSILLFGAKYVLASDHQLFNWVV